MYQRQQELKKEIRMTEENLSLRLEKAAKAEAAQNDSLAAKIFKMAERCDHELEELQRELDSVKWL